MIMCAKDSVKIGFLLWLVLLAAVKPSSAQILARTAIAPQRLEVTQQQTTTLFFIAPIKSVDRGSASIICTSIKGIENVLKVKARDSAFAPTNLTVYTKDGRIYPFDVYYSAAPPYPVQGYDSMNSGGMLLFSGSEHNDMEIRQLTDSLVAAPAIRHRPKAKANGGMHLAITGAYLSKDILLLQFKVANHSLIRYDLDFIHYYIRDKHQQKRTIAIEKEVKPLYVSYSQDPSVQEGRPLTIVAAFEKFTISDKKKFIVEIYEKNGDRRLSVAVKGRQLLRVRPI